MCLSFGDVAACLLVAVGSMRAEANLNEDLARTRSSMIAAFRPSEDVTVEFEESSAGGGGGIPGIDDDAADGGGQAAGCVWVCAVCVCV